MPIFFSCFFIDFVQRLLIILYPFLYGTLTIHYLYQWINCYKTTIIKLSMIEYCSVSIMCWIRLTIVYLYPTESPVEKILRRALIALSILDCQFSINNGIIKLKVTAMFHDRMLGIGGLWSLIFLPSIFNVWSQYVFNLIQIWISTLYSILNNL